MGTLPFAFSVHHFINSVGADAGFASIIGLAILILLYFAQARETASLRAHAYEASERIHELEARLARPQPSPEPEITAAVGPGRAVPAAASVSASSRIPGAVVGAGAPRPVMAGAPAGVGAPALTAATKLIPTASPVSVVSAAPDPQAGAVALGGPPPATVAAGAVGAGPLGAGAGGGNPGGATNGASGSSTLPPQRVAPPNTQSPPPRIQVRPGGTIPPGRRPPPPRGRAPQRGGGSRRVLGILLAALGLVAVVAVLLIVTKGSSNPKSTTNAPVRTTNSTGGRQRSVKRSGVNPAAVTVAVLNGTDTTGLAARVAQNLQTVGYKEGAIQTASDQTHSSTIVGYLPGFKQDGAAVAKSLKLSSATVQPVDQPAQAVACPTAGSCSANVIVTVGSDLATIQ